jgi:hypothetical protein
VVTNVYFVVEPEQIVAQDLAHAIHAFDSLAEVRLFRMLDEAALALTQDRPLAAILHADPARFVTSAAGRVLAEAGVPLAFLGTEAEARPMGADVLASPFSEASVAALLQRLVGYQSEAISRSGG